MNVGQKVFRLCVDQRGCTFSKASLKLTYSVFEALGELEGKTDTHELYPCILIILIIALSVFFVKYYLFVRIFGNS